MSFSFHEGERAVQRRAEGFDVADRIADHITPEISPPIAAFVADQPFVVLAAPDGAGRVWATLLHGAPGFARAADAETLVIDARFAPGDPLRDALTGAPADVGLLAIEPATRQRVRLNGTAISDGRRTVVRTREVYGNCPKYISARTVIGAGAPAAGAPEPGLLPVSADALDPAQQALVAATDTLFVATAHPAHGADASHRGGDAGFVTVADARHVSFPDYAGNTMYMTLGNLAADPRAGLLVPDFERGDLLLVSGEATIDWSPERAAAIPGAQRVVDVAIDRVVQLPGALPLRWSPAQRSRFTPPAPAQAAPVG
jgi:predicted pyridoxine 5'-phosphate oxidase superfamily flavin-nucleotide-binding protein